jgi:2-keto-4-pentenoate hydratase/2-oxohepta-3-ene-1,7-dioic acid hydratase in catechol pathway
MKLTTIIGKRGPVPAALLSDGTLADLALASAAGLIGDAPLRELADILDLDGELSGPVRRLVDRLEAQDASLLDHMTDLSALQDESDATYAPLLRPGLILAGGMAYKEHMQEMGVGLPSAPTAFLKSPGALNAHRQPLILPESDPGMVDFECEFSCVIGRTFHNVSPEEALQHVAGYTMANDVSSRTQAPAWLSSMKGNDPMECLRLYTLSMFDKQLPGFCPLGPVVVTADSFGDPDDVTIETRLNGEVMQSAHSSDLIFTLAYSLSYFSRWFRFQPGDVLTTGSPSGVGFARTPPRFLRDGDIIEVSARDIGILSNPVRAGGGA